MQVVVFSGKGETRNSEFNKGEIWKYETREHEERSCLIILDIDKKSTLGVLFFILIDNLKINDKNTKKEHQEKLIVTKKTLDNSVTRCMSKKPDLENDIEPFKDLIIDGDPINIPVWDDTISNILDHIDILDSSLKDYNYVETDFEDSSMPKKYTTSSVMYTLIEEPYKTKLNWLKKILTCGGFCRRPHP